MKYAAFMLAIVLSVTGCATIISGTSQVMTFHSSPSGAEVVVNGTSVGITPLTVTVARKKGTHIVVKKKGYREQSFVLKHKLEPWFWGNVIFGGVFGSTTDFATGATVEYSPDQYYTTLESEEAESGETTMGATESPDNRIIRFILVNYNALALDLSAGRGEHVTSLLQLLDISEEHSDEAITKIKALYVEHAEIPAFAESVAAAFAGSVSK